MLDWLPLIVCVGLLVNGVRLRGRLRRLDRLPASGRPVDPDHEFLMARGVRLSEAGRRAASNHASRERLDVLDLVPEDLTIERALDVARMVDTRTYRADRAARGRGAFQALLVRRDVLELADVPVRHDFDPVELVEVTERLKRYAPATTDLAVVPGLRSSRDEAAKRAKVQLRAYRWQPLNVAFPIARDVATSIGVTVNRPLGLAALLLFWLQPFYVCAGRVAVNPRDFARSPVVRILAGLEFVMSSVRLGRRDAKKAAKAKASGQPANPEKEAKKANFAARRKYYENELALGLDDFFDRPHQSCPWCGSRSTSQLFSSSDLVLRKPGRFQFDCCGRCGHFYQNPPLSPAGAEFYYRDVYDGMHADAIDALRGASADRDRSRAELVRPFMAPEAWLDVGCGRGHFGNVARDVWPQTGFDGIDVGDGAYEAARRGWLDYSYRGDLAEHVETVAGRYDVVSMFHHLEHTADPHLELDAAAKVLDAGGYLVLELPNPDCPAARRLGRFWFGWLVPQHQHLIRADNLVATLAERGFRTVLVQFGPAHQPHAYALAVFLLAQFFSPIPFWPWARKSPNPLRNLRWGLSMLLFAPLFAVAAVLDVVTAPWFRRGRRASAYRVVARKE